MNRLAALFYRIACFTCFAFALLHLVGHFSDPTKGLDAESVAVFETIRTHEFEVMGLKRTIADFLTGYSWYLMFFITFVGIVNLLILKRNQDDPAFLRQMTIANLGLFSLLLGVTWRYFIYPPLILFMLIWVFFLVSLIMKRKSA